MTECDRCGEAYPNLHSYNVGRFVAFVRLLTRQNQLKQICWKCERALGAFADAPISHEPQLQEGFDRVWLKEKREREAREWAESKTTLGFLIFTLGAIAFISPWPVILLAYLHSISAGWLILGPVVGYVIARLSHRALNSQPGNELIRLGRTLAVSSVVLSILPAIFVIPYALGA